MRARYLFFILLFLTYNSFAIQLEDIKELSLSSSERVLTGSSEKYFAVLNADVIYQTISLRFVELATNKVVYEHQFFPLYQKIGPIFFVDKRDLVIVSYVNTNSDDIDNLEVINLKKQSVESLDSVWGTRVASISSNQDKLFALRPLVGEASVFDLDSMQRTNIKYESKTETLALAGSTILKLVNKNGVYTVSNLADNHVIGSFETSEYLLFMNNSLNLIDNRYLVIYQQQSPAIGAIFDLNTGKKINESFSLVAVKGSEKIFLDLNKSALFQIPTNSANLQHVVDLPTQGPISVVATKNDEILYADRSNIYQFKISNAQVLSQVPMICKINLLLTELGKYALCNEPETFSWAGIK